MFPFYKTLRSIFTAKLYYIVIACALIAIVLDVGLAFLFTWFFWHLIDIQIPWLDTVVSINIGLFFVVAAWFSFPIVIVLVSGLFTEIVIRKINGVYYRDQSKKGGGGFLSDLKQDIKFTALSLFLNILLFPLCLFGIGLIPYLLLNSYLLGREFFVDAAGYHIGKSNGVALMSHHKSVILLGGFVITLLTLTPIVNLFIPIFAIGWMVHLFHKINRNHLTNMPCKSRSTGIKTPFF